MTIWSQYLQVSTQHPFTLAFCQFAILGTAGEIVATLIRQGRMANPFLSLRTLLKALAWGFLGIYIKVMFLTASAGVDAFSHYGLEGGAFVTAIARSTLMNLMLGPSMMILHRLTDNAIDRQLGYPALGWKGLDRSMLSLVWLWIPLHTVTFLQAPEVRVGLAALLSLVLGVVMGYFGRGAQAQQLQSVSPKTA